MALRADFCGPDGSPLLSILVDSLGSTLYSPDEASAWRVPGGLPFGTGLLDVNALISLIRTGFPHVPVQWEMMDALSDGTPPEWKFISSAGDTMSAVLKDGALFPSVISDGISLEAVTGSWHDSFRLWPLEWEFSSDDHAVVIRIRSIEEVAEHPAASLELNVPVPVDTASARLDKWTYLEPVPIR